MADVRTGRTTITRAEYRDDAIAALTQHLSRYAAPTAPTETAPTGRSGTSAAPGRRAEAPAPPTLPPLTPTDDLAANPPGKALRDRLDASGQGLVERVVARLLRRPTEEDSWRRGRVGERRVGAELNRLRRHGWRVLHSLPLPGQVDIDHLLIGPGGVFTVNTKHHHKKAVWVGDDSVRIDHGKPAPYAGKSRAESRRVTRVLEHFCGFPVPVQPVLVFVGVSEQKVVASQVQVRVYRERQVSALAALSGVLSADQVEQVYSVARHRQAWTLA